MKTDPSKPPQFAQWILHRLLMNYSQSPALGDVNEIYEEMEASEGRKKARSWYRRQVWKSIPHMIHQYLYWWVSLLKSYFRITIRSMSRFKLSSILNIAGLTLGLTCACLVFMWVQYEYSYDRFHANADDLYRVVFRTDNTGKHNRIYHGEWQPGTLAPFL